MVHTDTPCYSYHDESSHFVHLSSSIAAQKAVAGRPSACRAQRSMKRVAAQGLAPGLVVAHRPLLVTQTATLFARAVHSVAATEQHTPVRHRTVAEVPNLENRAADSRTIGR